MILPQHDWPLDTREAAALQESYRKKVIKVDRLERLERVAGVDVGFEKQGAITRAALVVLDYETLEVLEITIAKEETRFPYVPGLLSFRELPAVVSAVSKLSRAPDLYICDGQGYAHPRRFGLACHLGVLMDTPSIGVAKTRLIGDYSMPGNDKGDWKPLRDDDEIIGAVLRTRTGVKPVFVSIGHRLCLQSAIKCVMHCVTRYRLPETTRQAHHYASRVR